MIRINKIIVIGPVADRDGENMIVKMAILKFVD